MTPARQVALELKDVVDEYDRCWFDTFGVSIIIRPHIVGELWPWTVPAGTQVAVTREAGRLRVRVIRMRARDDGDLA
jgi:hypothetical protein